MTDDDRQAREDAASELHQFASLVRAHITRATESVALDDAEAGSHHLTAWQEIYGVSIDLQPGEDFVDRIGRVFGEKLAVAAAFVATLAIKNAALTDRTAIEVVDEVERDFADWAEQPGHE